MRLPIPETEITVERLERCLDRLALEIEALGPEGEVYFPIWDRLEREIEIRRKKNDTLAAVRERVKRSRDHTKAQSF